MAKKSGAAKFLTEQQVVDSYAHGVENPVDTMMEAVNSSLRGKFGEVFYSNNQEQSRVICLRVPFAFQYLLQQEGLTLGRYMTIVGPPLSCKSAFTYELARMFRQSMGGFTLIETEKKDSPELRCSITGYDERRAQVLYASSIEEYQMMLKECMDVMKEKQDSVLRPPRSVPWLFVIDSITAVTTQSIGSKIEEAGSGLLAQPQHAVIISNFHKILGHWFDTYPYVVVGTNHLKLAQDRYGNMNVRNMAGGYAPQFHESLELELSRDRNRKEIERREPRHEHGVRLNIAVYKNSTASHAEKIEIEMLWYSEQVLLPNGNTVRLQRTYWDWESAAIELLLKPPVDKVRAKDIRNIVDLHENMTRREVYSKALGISQDNPMSFHQAGELLQQRPDLMEQLYEPLGIRRRTMFTPGKDYRVQRSEAAANAIILPNDGMKPMFFSPNEDLQVVQQPDSGPPG